MFLSVKRKKRQKYQMYVLIHYLIVGMKKDVGVVVNQLESPFVIQRA